MSLILSILAFWPIAVQLGFILGTLGFSLSGLADRFAASRIFAVCAVLGAAANAGFSRAARDDLPVKPVASAAYAEDWRRCWTAIPDA
jgi:hypothetical protein